MGKRLTELNVFEKNIDGKEFNYVMSKKLIVEAPIPRDYLVPEKYQDTPNKKKNNGPSKSPLLEPEKTPLLNKILKIWTCS